MLKMGLEVCVDNVESAINAWNGGAQRIELCSSLSLGGLTPSVGLMRIIKRLVPPSCLVFVMIRAKPGEDYICHENDVNVMVEDIKVLKENGADGFVFGCLDKDKQVDREACIQLLQAAKGYPCTFHRAFDVISNPEEALPIISNLGFSRILTSGQKETAYLGREFIKKLVCRVKELNSQLIIVAGGGIDLTNLTDILLTTQVREFHGSAKATCLKYSKPHDKMNAFTDESVVREMVKMAAMTEN